MKPAAPRYRSPITLARARRTKQANYVLRAIGRLLTEPATWDARGRKLEPGDDTSVVPSWWPFWSDNLKDQVRELVRLALELEALEEPDEPEPGAGDRLDDETRPNV